MRDLPPLVSCLLLLTLPVTAHAVSTGDSRERVLFELGAPEGTASMGRDELLYYPRGNVRLTNGRVVSCDLLTEAEFALRQSTAAKENPARAQRLHERQARLEVEGRAILTARESDPAFAALPGVEQLRLWQIFAMRYPMIPVHEKIARLQARVDFEDAMRHAADARESELALLRTRVDDAEKRAARAEQLAGRSYRGSYYGFPYFNAPFTHKASPLRRSDHGCAVTVDRAAAPPPAHPADAARARIMGSFDRARNEIYARSGR